MFPKRVIIFRLKATQSECLSFVIDSSEYAGSVRIACHIQDVSEGRAIILRGQSIGHSKQKYIRIYMCPIQIGFPGRAIVSYFGVVA
jgi:hypothetical protein